MSKNIYVELDSLLDTRLATLLRMNEDEASRLLLHGYRNRLTDDWSKLGSTIDIEAYKKAYAARDGNTLKAARCSGVVPMLNTMIEALEESKINTPFVDDIVVHLNVWPYRIAENVIDDLCATVKYLSGLELRVVSCSYAPAELTPALIFDKWDGLIMYNIDEWLNLHVESLKKTKLTKIAFISPALFRNSIPNREDITIEGIGELSPFASLEIVLTEFLTLHLVEAKYFSLVEL